MDRYRLIIGGRAEFAVEITNEQGDIHITGGFHTLLAADAWMANRQEVAESAEAYRAKFAPDLGSLRQPVALHINDLCFNPIGKLIHYTVGTGKTPGHRSPVIRAGQKREPTNR